MIFDPQVSQRFHEAISDRKAIYISNHNLGGDPQFGVRKTFVIQYKSGGNDYKNVVKRRRMLEGETLDFDWDIIKATYGAPPPVRPMDHYPGAYEKLFWALDHKESVWVENTMSGFDPAYGTVKVIKVFYTDSGGNVNEAVAREYCNLDFIMRA
jgi:hypothetical protein